MEEGIRVENRITSDPKIMRGEPCIRNLRIPVAMIIDSLADGMTIEEILRELPALDEEDIRASLRYAAYRIREEIYFLKERP